MNGRTNSRHRQPTSGNTGDDQHRDPRVDSTERRLAKTLSIMIGFFTLSILPIVLCFLALLFDGLRADVPKTLNKTGFVAYSTMEFVTALFLVCNSLWNFFIYNARNKDFRKAYRKLRQRWRKKWCPRGPFDWSARLQTTFRSNTSTRRTETTGIGLQRKEKAVRTISKQNSNSKQYSNANSTPVYGRRVGPPLEKMPSNGSASPVYGRICEEKNEAKCPKNVAKCPKNEENCTKNDEKCTKNEEKCTKNEEKCTKNEAKCPKNKENCPKNEENCTENDENCTKNEEPNVRTESNEKKCVENAESVQPTEKETNLDQT